MRSFAVLCIIATVAAEADSQADYTASIGHIANKTDGHIAAEVNTLESNPNDCTNVDHFTGVATTLKLGESTPGSGTQWCNTATCVTDPDDPEGPNILDYEHDTSGTFACGDLPFDIPAGETWTTAICDGAVSCAWKDVIPGRVGCSNSTHDSIATQFLPASSDVPINTPNPAYAPAPAFDPACYKAGAAWHGKATSPYLVATDTVHTQPAEKRMVTTITQDAMSLGGHQCAVTHGASTIGTIATDDCICICKA